MTDPDAALRRLAILSGFETEWHDYKGRHRHVSLDTLRALLRAAGVDATDPVAALAHAEEANRQARLPPRLTGTAGEVLRLALPPTDQPIPWRLITEAGATDGTAWAEHGAIAIPLPPEPGEARLALGGAIGTEAALTIAPPRCFQGVLATRRAWGIGAQIYALRMRGDGGFGHLGALPGLVRAAAAQGADAVALSPTHALFAADAGHYSPYSPSSRSMLNGWLADPAGLPDLAFDPALAEDAAPLIDYATAIPRRLAALRALFDRFATAPDALRAEFAAFRAQGGAGLEDHAHFEALHAHHLRADPAAWDWRRWPAPFRDPRSPAVAAFAAECAQEVSFHAFLQWIAARQLGAAQAAARAAGMGIGLVADLAVGTHAGGSRAWSRTAALLEGMSIGAPPDGLNTRGQDWGLTTFAPARLAEAGYAPFLEDLRAAMRHAGAVRIDHVMGLARIWCIPEGAGATDGAYLRFPVTDLMRLLAAESHRHGAVVIGEDLGTLPHGYREVLDRNALLGLRVLFFERDWQGGFTPAAHYAPNAVATSTTHDMPTLAGWWRGVDIGLRAGLGLLPEGRDEAAEHAARDHDRRALWHAVGGEGDPPEAPEERLGVAVARFLSAAPSALAMLPLEDAILAEEQVNLPGTVEQHPNWRRRLPKPAEALLTEPPAAAILGAMRRG